MKKPGKHSDNNKRKTADSKRTSKKNSDTKYNFKSKDKDQKAGVSKRSRYKAGGAKLPKFDDKVRLNKYIANAGICSRREADVLIQTGVITVNGKIITEMGYKVGPSDKIAYDGETIKKGKKYYILVNKPYDFSINKANVPSKRNKTIPYLLQKTGIDDLFPVGKFGSKDGGLILYTNDADMDKKLMHPKFKVSQILHIVLNKDISDDHLQKMQKGIFVDNKMQSVTEASFVENAPKNEIGIKIFSNKTNTVKAMLKKLEYEIVKFDRVEFAGLTKYDLPRGSFRNLTDKEIIFLQMA